MKGTGLWLVLPSGWKFENPFYRVDQSRSRAVGSSGLELALVKDIAEKYGGTVTVESVPREGTVFFVWFDISDTLC